MRTRGIASYQPCVPNRQEKDGCIRNEKEVNMKRTTDNLAIARTLVLACMALTGGLQAATTFDELQSALEEAADGATVYVENDISYTGVLAPNLAKRITLASPPGQTNVLLRASNYASGAFLRLTDAAANVTLTNLVVDGNKSAGTQSDRFIDIQAGRLTLDAGTELRNVQQGPAGSILVLDPGELVMNDGAVLRGFVNAQWGTCVLAGWRGASGRFTMNGGLITGCASTFTGSEPAGAYGGAVYTWGGIFDMHGGLITGNTASYACAGVAAYQGHFILSGTASVTNNAGETVNDISYWGNGGANGYLYIAGPWTGAATVYAPRIVEPDQRWACFVAPHEGFTPGDDDMPGLGNLSVQDYPNFVANGYGREVYTDAGLVLSPHQLNVYFKPRIARLGNRLSVASPTELMDQLADGDEVEICQDFDLPRTLVVSNNWTLTLRSDTNGPWTVSNSANSRWAPLARVKNATLRLENIVFDGRRNDGDAKRLLATMLEIQAGGNVTLGNGAVLQNGMLGEKHPAAHVFGSGSRLAMEPGSVVRNFSTTNANSFATAFRIGERTDADSDPKPVFTMTGGTISNCVSGTEGTAAEGYGGAVYVQNAVFDFQGGTISGNAAPSGGCAGVMVYYGATVQIGGTATVTNNPGVCPDLYRCAGGTVRMTGAFRGRVGVSSGNQAFDGCLYIACSEGATGAWNFFSAKTDPYGRFIGYMRNDNRVVYLGSADGWLDGVGLVCAYENFAHFTPTAIDVDAEANALPHVFGGKAVAAGGRLNVTFDEAAAREAGRTNVMLLAAREGEFLTGTWHFTVPRAARGVWKVNPVRTEQGIVAYRLVWLPTGTIFVIR